jgi:hypothetical protein
VHTDRDRTCAIIDFKNLNSKRNVTCWKMYEPVIASSDAHLLAAPRAGSLSDIGEPTPTPDSYINIIFVQFELIRTNSSVSKLGLFAFTHGQINCVDMIWVTKPRVPRSAGLPCGLNLGVLMSTPMAQWNAH